MQWFDAKEDKLLSEPVINQYTDLNNDYHGTINYVYVYALTKKKRCVWLLISWLMFGSMATHLHIDYGAWHLD